MARGLGGPVSRPQREVVFESAGEVSLVPVDLPDRPSPYGVVVRARLSLVSAGTELGYLSGPLGPGGGRSYPVRPGTGLVGEIVEIGAAVPTVRPDLVMGGRVFVRGRHQELVRCDVLTDTLYPVPDAVTDEAMLLARQGIIGVHALRTAGIGLGSSVHVIGLGVVGQLLSRLAVVAGARPVSAADHHPNRRAAATSPTIRTENPAEGSTDGADAVFVVCTGATAVEEGLRAVAPGGALVLVCAVEHPGALDLADAVFRRNVRILGAHEVGVAGLQADPARWRDQLDFCAGLVADGSLDVEGLVTHRVAPSAVAWAYRTIDRAKGSCLGVAIDWSLT